MGWHYQASVSSSILHWPVLDQVKPSLDDAKNQPKHGHRHQRPADQDNGQKATNRHAQQTQPEGLYLPAKMTFKPRTSNIFTADIVDDNPGKERQRTRQKTCRLECINYLHEAFQALFGVLCKVIEFLLSQRPAAGIIAL